MDQLSVNGCLPNPFLYFISALAKKKEQLALFLHPL